MSELFRCRPLPENTAGYRLRLLRCPPLSLLFGCFTQLNLPAVQILAAFVGRMFLVYQVSKARVE